jgi:hypothetical protein
VRACFVTTRKSKAHFETAETAFRVRFRGKDHHYTGVQEAIEQSLREIFAILDCVAVEKGLIAKSRC